MAEHPIQGLMKTAMENIKEMVDVNTIVGDPVETPDGSIILPISRVGFGFAAGGTEFEPMSDGGKQVGKDGEKALPFGGGTGGGISITPIAFLVVGQQGVRLLPLDSNVHIYERMLEMVPQVFDKLQSMVKGGGNGTGQKNDRITSPDHQPYV
jgi:sporulation protein YtfJ